MPDVPIAIDGVHEGDCIELMKSIPDSSAQLVIADPPYNIGKKFGDGKQWTDIDEWLPWCRQWLSESVRVMADGASIFVYGIHHYLAYLQVELYDLDLTYRRQIIWHYENGFSGYKNTLAAHYEPILWFSKGDQFTYHPIREPYKSQERLKYKVNKNGKAWTPHPDGRLAGDVWRFPVLAGRRFRDEKVDHPTQKPLSLTNRIVTHFSNPDDLIVIPFAGSGTECVSAKANGRRFWASEIESEYVALANLRMGLTDSQAQVSTRTSPEGPDAELRLFTR